MIAEIIAVGTELLMGQITNTNARYVSERFPDADVYVYYHTVVGDNPQRLSSCLDIALKRADVILTTGGLGPTQDDLTKETIANALGLRMVPDEETLQKIHGFFNKLGRTATANNEKQGYFPEGAIILRNDNGTAPGCIIEKNEKTVVMLPGPPWEMEPMFEQSVLPFFMKRANYKLKSVFIRMFGIGESSMETVINDLITAQSNPTIAPYAKMGETTLRVTVKYIPGRENPDEMMAPVLNEIKDRLGKYIYSYNNEELHQVTSALLMKNKTGIAIAESCTGGKLTSMLTDIPGISSVLYMGAVTYSNQSKINVLGVLPETIERYGAVSAETAIEMAEGARKTCNCGIGLSITGIAGPDGGTVEKPVGTVFIAISDAYGTKTKQLKLWGGRDRIRYSSCLHALDMIRRHELGMEVED
ncbi:MAG TPA: competence/damage-inducible protein A [Clostridia bacterium]|nr:competence/damage-inducible protein A [Clostridia bacterium]HPQ45806.1 competence/damage-inducible protein A [Clostridia bacterium]HRX42132.1 competence/damage-inducible protein A [Clostridia bacterium]